MRGHRAVEWCRFGAPAQAIARLGSLGPSLTAGGWVNRGSTPAAVYPTVSGGSGGASVVLGRSKSRGGSKRGGGPPEPQPGWSFLAAGCSAGWFRRPAPLLDATLPRIGRAGNLKGWRAAFQPGQSATSIKPGGSTAAHVTASLRTIRQSARRSTAHPRSGPSGCSARRSSLRADHRHPPPIRYPPRSSGAFSDHARTPAHLPGRAILRQSASVFEGVRQVVGWPVSTHQLHALHEVCLYRDANRPNGYRQGLGAGAVATATAPASRQRPPPALSALGRPSGQCPDGHSREVSDGKAVNDVSSS